VELAAAICAAVDSAASALQSVPSRNYSSNGLSFVGSPTDHSRSISSRGPSAPEAFEATLEAQPAVISTTWATQVILLIKLIRLAACGCKK
jgi:hypothetical protein